MLEGLLVESESKGLITDFKNKFYTGNICVVKITVE
jgi:hypothetical protein